MFYFLCLPVYNGLDPEMSFDWETNKELQYCSYWKSVAFLPPQESIKIFFM